MVQIYAVGDVHGEIDKLIDVYTQIIEDASGEDYRVFFIGDYVDRGSDSARVIDFVRGNPRNICLKGNHEDMMIEDYPYWRSVPSYGGITERSYEGFEGFYDFKRDCRWAASLPLYSKFGRLLFVHAGVNPLIPLEEQNENTLLWERRFCGYTGEYHGGWLVVHGHTPVDEPTFTKNTLNIDTGCGKGGKLTGVRLSQAGPEKYFFRM